VSWASHWLSQSRRIASRRHRRYGLKPPPRIAALLQDQPSHLGVLNSIRLIIYALIGSPRGLLRILWWHLTDRDTPGRKRRVTGLIEELAPLLSRQCRLLPGYFERRLYSRDVARVPRALEKTLHRTTPLLVVQPCGEGDILQTLTFCSARRLPVYPRGVSSSPFGGAVPTTNGVVLDLSPMMDVLKIDPERKLVRVQPGARWADLDNRLKPLGLALYTSPTSRFSTVGGWLATGGLGIAGFGHGHLSRHVQAVRVVLARGDVLSLEAGDSRLQLLFGTEGKLAVVTEITLRVRRRPRFSRAELAYFENVPSAMELVDQLAEDHQPGPQHLAFYSRQRMEEENQLFRHLHGKEQPLVRASHALLLHFDEKVAHQRFAELARERKLDLESNRAAAAYLWSERYFPLKAQRIGPSLLASEVVLSRQAVPRFLRRGEKLARRFGSPLAFEAFFGRTDQGLRAVTIASFTCDARRRWDYLLRLLLVQLLTRRAVKLGGHPYGFGIWNSPFVTRRFKRPQRRQLLQHKKQWDPQLVLNPMKHFRVRLTVSIPGVLFMGPVFQTLLMVADLFAPVIGAFARRGETSHHWEVPSAETDHGYPLLADTVLRCTFCGACVSTCPAYWLTRDELVTGRAKLKLADTMMGRDEVLQREAHSPFQCLRCGLCEEVCQTRLPLRQCYDVLELWIREEHGQPTEMLQQFACSVDQSRHRLAQVFGLRLAHWSPQTGPYVSLPQGEAAKEPRS
jgi:FAD/FMN-containing dehydrogenase/ferredoxin